MTRYTFDSAHSTIELSIRHLVLATLRGRFTNFAGWLELDPRAVSRSRVVAEIGAASVTTDEAARDAYLRSADVLDVAAHPLISFASTRVESVGSQLRVTGDLSIRGVTREVVLHVETLGHAPDRRGTYRAAFSAKASIDRRDFGLHVNQLFEAGGVVVGDQVEVRLEILAVEAAVQAAA